MYLLGIYDLLSTRRAKTLPGYLPRLANRAAKEVARQVLVATCQDHNIDVLKSLL